MFLEKLPETHFLLFRAGARSRKSQVSSETIRTRSKEKQENIWIWMGSNRNDTGERPQTINIDIIHKNTNHIYMYITI